MNPFALPSLPAGPGSQPEEPDGAELDYLPMPRGMETYRPPRLPEPEEAAAFPAAFAALERLLEALKTWRIGASPVELDLAGLPAPDRETIDQTLGEGEVAVRIETHPDLRIVETRLAGVWRIRAPGTEDRPGIERLEVADIPALVRIAAFAGAAEGTDPGAELPPGIMNAPAVLIELDAQARSWSPGDLPHVVNLTLLPQTPEDLAYLDQRLGRGPVAILSRGYGSCRIVSTGLTRCWWVQHFNADERLILNTLEVVDLPAAALAAQEDIDDSADRLREILEAIG
jgi:hydrogenase-1 operon protein HyaF